MALKTYNPTTPGQRQLVMVDRSALYKGKPVKALTEGNGQPGPSLYCAVIVKTVDAQTRSKTGINELLRD